MITKHSLNKKINSKP